MSQFSKALTGADTSENAIGRLNRAKTSLKS